MPIGLRSSNNVARATGKSTSGPTRYSPARNQSQPKGVPYKGRKMDSPSSKSSSESASSAWSNKYKDPLEGLLESEVRAYIAGDRGLGQDFIEKAYNQSKLTLGDVKDESIRSLNKSAVSRGIYESGIPIENQQNVEKNYMRSLGDIRTSLELGVAETNLGQKRFGMGAGQNLATMRSNRALGYAGMQNAYDTANMTSARSLQAAQMQIAAQQMQSQAEISAANAQAMGMGLGSFAGDISSAAIIA